MVEGKVIPEVPGAYRQPGARPALSDSDRRWYTKSGDVEKGPYERDVLARSVKSGVLKRTALVRAEDETEWRPVYAVDALKAVLQPKGPGWTASREDASGEIQGSFGAGFAAGFFGGIIGLVLVLALAKGPDTRRGAGTGCAVGMALGFAVRAMFALGH